VKLNAQELATDRWENEGGRTRHRDRSKGENVMAWFIENWFWLLIFGAFVSMHLFGHGGHGGHRRGAQGAADVEGAPARVASSKAGGHQH
jgi:hypothetical protein